MFIQFNMDFEKNEFICKKLSLVLSSYCLLLDRIAIFLYWVFFFHFWADKNSSFHFIWSGQWNKVNEMHKIKKGMLKIMNKSHTLYVHPNKYNANEIDFSPLDSFFFLLSRNSVLYMCEKEDYQLSAWRKTPNNIPKTNKSMKKQKKEFKTPEKESKQNWKAKKNIEPIVYHFFEPFKMYGFLKNIFHF